MIEFLKPTKITVTETNGWQHQETFQVGEQFEAIVTNFTKTTKTIEFENGATARVPFDNILDDVPDERRKND